MISAASIKIAIIKIHTVKKTMFPSNGTILNIVGNKYRARAIPQTIVTHTKTRSFVRGKQLLNTAVMEIMISNIYIIV